MIKEFFRYGETITTRSLVQPKLQFAFALLCRKLHFLYKLTGHTPQTGLEPAVFQCNRFTVCPDRLYGYTPLSIFVIIITIWHIHHLLSFTDLICYRTCSKTIRLNLCFKTTSLDPTYKTGYQFFSLTFI